MSYNLQGIIRKANISITNEFDRLAYITQNFANVNTNGYKSVRFENVMDADGSVHGVERTDMKTGDYIQTNNPLDVAVTGAGYIPVTTQNGEIHYTRDGGFMTDKDGMLVTKTGSLVGSGIKIDGASEKIEIKPNGDVYFYKTLLSEPEYAGTIPLVQFQNPEALKDVGANEFETTEEAGEMKLVEEHSLIKQYGVERSNIDFMAEVYDISRVNASILATAKLMKSVTDMYAKAINLTD